MVTWVRCTTTDGLEAYVNLTNVTSILEAGPGQTVISFVGDSSIIVKETTDDILPRTQR